MVPQTGEIILESPQVFAIPYVVVRRALVLFWAPLLVPLSTSNSVAGGTAAVSGNHNAAAGALLLHPFQVFVDIPH